jgi:hypothetical protein
MNLIPNSKGSSVKMSTGTDPYSRRGIPLLGDGYGAISPRGDGYEKKFIPIGFMSLCMG